MRALLHAPSPRLTECELTFQSRQPIDLDLARRQHGDYAALLADLGVATTIVDSAIAHADSVFVEDTAVVVEECAVLTRMGAPSRRAEVAAIAPQIARLRPIVQMPEGQLEGGDVLRLRRELFVGRSQRTDERGIAALRRVLAPHGYRVHSVAVHGCLHLKTAVTAVGDDLLLGNPRWFDAAVFGDREILEVPVDEPQGCNALLVGATACLPASAPKTALLLRARGIEVRTVDISEFEKAEAGMTCMSLLFA